VLFSIVFRDFVKKFVVVTRVVNFANSCIYALDVNCYIATFIYVCACCGLLQVNSSAFSCDC